MAHEIIGKPLVETDTDEFKYVIVTNIRNMGFNEKTNQTEYRLSFMSGINKTSENFNDAIHLSKDAIEAYGLKTFTNSLELKEFNVPFAIKHRTLKAMFKTVTFIELHNNDSLNDITLNTKKL